MGFVSENRNSLERWLKFSLFNPIYKFIFSLGHQFYDTFSLHHVILYPLSNEGTYVRYIISNIFSYII